MADAPAPPPIDEEDFAPISESELEAFQVADAAQKAMRRDVEAIDDAVFELDIPALMREVGVDGPVTADGAEAAGVRLQEWIDQSVKPRMTRAAESGRINGAAVQRAALDIRPAEPRND